MMVIVLVPIKVNIIILIIKIKKNTFNVMQDAIIRTVWEM